MKTDLSFNQQYEAGTGKNNINRLKGRRRTWHAVSANSVSAALTFQQIIGTCGSPSKVLASLPEDLRYALWLLAFLCLFCFVLRCFVNAVVAVDWCAPLSHPSSCMLVNHGPSQQSSKDEEYEP